MKDVAKHPWLWERKEKNGTRMFYLRARVPKELLDIYGREQIKKSLRTQDRKEANRLINTEAAFLEEEFEAHRRKKARVKRGEVTKAQLWVLAEKWFREHNQADLDAWQYRDEWEREQARDIVRDDLGALAKLDDPRIYQEFASEADALLDRNSIALNRAGWLYHYLVQQLCNASVELHRRRLARVDGDFDTSVDTRFDRPLSVQTGDRSTTAIGADTLTLEKAMEAYLDDPSGKSREKKTELGYDFTFRVMREVIGADTSMDALGRDHCRKVRDALIRMPPNASKRFPSLTLLEAADHATLQGLKPMSSSTVNSYVSKMSSFLGWAFREQYIGANPAMGLLLEEDKDDRDKRDPFSLQQLQRVFNAPLYRGCWDDEKGYAVPGNQIVRRSRFWVPLLSLFHGMRLNEICQLSLADIQALDTTLAACQSALNIDPYRRPILVLAQISCSYSGFPVTRSADMVGAEEGPTICRSNLTL